MLSAIRIIDRAGRGPMVHYLQAGSMEIYAMWDTVDTSSSRLSHDLPCLECGHGRHTYLPCSDACACVHGRDRVLASA